MAVNMNPKALEPDWDSMMVIRARKIARNGGSIDEAMRVVGTRLSRDAARRRFKNLGVTFTPRYPKRSVEYEDELQGV
jgi:hypothetical protein